MGQSFEKKKRSTGEGNYLAAVRQSKFNNGLDGCAR